jgi:hypothetical protein
MKLCIQWLAGKGVMAQWSPLVSACALAVMALAQRSDVGFIEHLAPIGDSHNVIAFRRRDESSL